MGIGLQIWDANGVLVFDTNDRVTKVHGRISISASGSAPFTLLRGNNPFYIFMPTSWDMVNFSPPNIGVSNDTITWTYPAGRSPLPGILLFGMF